MLGFSTLTNMKTKHYIIALVIAFVVSWYCQWEYFVNVVSGDGLLISTSSDAVLFPMFIIASGVLQATLLVWAMVWYFRRYRQSKTQFISAHAVLVAITILTLIPTVASVSIAISNGYLGTSPVLTLLLPAISLMLLVFLFLRKQWVYIIYLILGIWFLLGIVSDITSTSHYSWFEFLGSGMPERIAVALAVIFFANFARRQAYINKGV
jgi:hypothetical protein